MTWKDLSLAGESVCKPGISSFMLKICPQQKYLESSAWMSGACWNTELFWHLYVLAFLDL